MVMGYVLLNTEPGLARSVRDVLTSVAGIAEVEETIGRYDLIVRVAVDDETDLRRVLEDVICETAGVSFALPCFRLAA